MQSISKTALIFMACLALSLASCNKDNASESAAEKATTGNAASALVKLPVTGMTCESCEQAITGQLLKQAGVISAVASHVDQLVTVSYDPGQISEDQLVENIELLGFDVTGRGITPGSEEPGSTDDNQPDPDKEEMV